MASSIVVFQMIFFPQSKVEKMMAKRCVELGSILFSFLNLPFIFYLVLDASFFVVFIKTFSLVQN